MKGAKGMCVDFIGEECKLNVDFIGEGCMIVQSIEAKRGRALVLSVRCVLFCFRACKQGRSEGTHPIPDTL